MISSEFSGILTIGKLFLIYKLKIWKLFIKIKLKNSFKLAILKIEYFTIRRLILSCRKLFYFYCIYL